jgi:hypothetical protein
VNKLLRNIIEEEYKKHQQEKIQEEIRPEDEDEIRDIIRSEVSAIFFDLFKKRRTWGA